ITRISDLASRISLVPSVEPSSITSTSGWNDNILSSTGPTYLRSLKTGTAMRIRTQTPCRVDQLAGRIADPARNGRWIVEMAPKPVKPYLALALTLLTLAGCVTHDRQGQVPRPLAVDHYITGVEAYKSGDRDAAKEALRRANELNPELTMSRVLLGDIYREEHAYHEAIEQYEVAAELDPYGYINH